MMMIMMTVVVVMLITVFLPPEFTYFETSKDSDLKDDRI
jgi:hypothetical protein